MTQYLELEIVILLAAIIVTMGAVIVYKDRSSHKKQQADQADPYQLQKLNRHLSSKKMTFAERERMARRKQMRQRMAR